MCRYIDANLAQTIADKELSVNDAGTVQFVLQHTVTADVQEVKHAHWIIRKLGVNAQCSNCKRYFNDVYDIDNADNYCRHCGARMDGDDK